MISFLLKLLFKKPTYGKDAKVIPMSSWEPKEKDFGILPPPPAAPSEPEKRKPPQAGIDIIKKWEGLHLKPYLDVVGIPTIGYGTTLYEDGRKVAMQDPAITKERAEELLTWRLQAFCDAALKVTKVSVSDNQLGAILSLIYNIGIGAYTNSTLLRLLNAGDYKGAAAQFLVWNKATENGVKRVIQGLTNRRIDEKALFERP